MPFKKSLLVCELKPNSEKKKNKQIQDVKWLQVKKSKYLKQ